MKSPVQRSGGRFEILALNFLFPNFFSFSFFILWHKVNRGQIDIGVVIVKELQYRLLIKGVACAVSDKSIVWPTYFGQNRSNKQPRLETERKSPEGLAVKLSLNLELS